MNLSTWNEVRVSTAVAQVRRQLNHMTWDTHDHNTPCYHLWEFDSFSHFAISRIERFPGPGLQHYEFTHNQPLEKKSWTKRILSWLN